MSILPRWTGKYLEQKEDSFIWSFPNRAKLPWTTFETNVVQAGQRGPCYPRSAVIFVLCYFCGIMAMKIWYKFQIQFLDKLLRQMIFTNIVFL